MSSRQIWRRRYRQRYKATRWCIPEQLLEETFLQCKQVVRTQMALPCPLAHGRRSTVRLRESFLLRVLF